MKKSPALLKNRNKIASFHILRNGLFLTLLSFLMPGCDYTRNPSFDDIEAVKGFKPIYRPYQELQEIKTGPPKPLVNPGKIYVYRNFLFVNESGKGVHVFNNTNPADPKPYSFIAIEGNVDISIKEDVLYADNLTDLVAIDISDVGNISVSARIEDVFESQDFMPLPRNDVYFECPDHSKGVVIGWEEVVLKNPKCYY